MTTHALLIPCETFEVDAILAATENLTTLEKLVLRALYAGVQGAEDLNDVFAVGYRPMLQLLLDLLDRALVTFDFSKGEIHLSPDAREKIRTNKLDDIEAIGRTSQKLGLMRDLVSGSILVKRGQPPVKPATRLQVRKEANSVKSIDIADVGLAIRGEVRRRLKSIDRPMHVLEVAFDRTKFQGEIRDLEIAVRATIDAATDRLIIQVTGPDDLPARNRAQIEKALNDLANVEPPDLALKNLRDAATPSETPTQLSLYGQVHKLRDQVAQLKSADRGTWAARQAALLTSTAAIEEAIVRQHTGSIRATYITDPGELAKAIDEVIASAKRQIVIASPAARYDAMQQFRASIEAALANGRKIFFLFGARTTAPQLEVSVRNWLHRQAETYRDQFFFTDVESARCNGRFVVGDGADLVVTSRDFLNHAANDGLTTGIRMTATTPVQDERRPVLPIAADVLRVAKEIFPDFTAAQELIDVPYRLGFLPPPPSSQVEPPRLPERSGAGDDELHPARVGLWLRQWDQRVAELDTWTTQIGTTYELVRDDAHLQFLYDAFRTVERGLFIGADIITDDAVSRRFVDELTACLRRAAVTISYRRCDPRARATLEQLATHHRDALILREWSGAGSAPRLLLCDDWAILGSFDFGAAPAKRAGAARLTMEIGVRVDGGATVNAIRAGLREVLPDPGKSRAPVATEVPSAPTTLNTGRGLAELLDQMGTEPRRTDALKATQHVGEVLRSWFAAAPSISAAFSELHELEAIGVPFADQAIATALHVCREDSAERDRWLARLVQRRWQRRDFAGVVLLMATLRQHDSPGIPPPPIALLTARVIAGIASESMWEDPVLSADEHAAMALASLAIPLVIFDPQPPSQALPVLHGSLPPPLQRWAAATIAFRQAHSGGVQRSQLDAVAAKLGGADRREQARKSLEGALREFLDWRSAYKLLTLVWSRLAGGPFGLQRLQKAVSDGDMKFVREFVSRHSADPETLLDDTIAELVKRADWYGSTEIFPTRRARMIADLSTIFESARALVGDRDTASGKPDAMADHIVALAQRLAADTPAVSALAATPTYAAPLVAGLCAQLKPLLELAR